MRAVLASPSLPPSLPGVTRELSEEQIQFFRQNGYLAVDRVTSQEEVAKVRAILQRLFDDKAGFKEGANFNFAGAEEDPDAPNIPQIIGPRNFASNLLDTEFYRNAEVFARQVLGPEARFRGDHTLVKPAIEGPATPWHQDEAFRSPEYDYDEISVWMPLQEVNDVNGCMAFIPESNLHPVLPHRSPNNDPRVHVLECYDGFNPADAVSCPIPAGGCTFHFGRTLHGAGPNRSTDPRYAYVLCFAVPPVPARTVREFPWLANKDTAQLRRMRSWMKSGGMFVEAWRLIKQTEMRDYGMLVGKMTRKVRMLFQLLGKRNGDDGKA